jgi:phosphoribosylglycinamide formyltransferase-1
MLRLAFLASNNGSSMRALIAAIRTGALEATPVLVVSNKASSGALAFAREAGLPAQCVPTLPDAVAADAALCAALRAAGADLVVLSGYLRRLGPQTLAAFENKILNVHPSLLPAFGGEGMYGRRVHEAVAAAGVAHSGATIHVVDALYDHGPIIAQRVVALAPGDDAAAIERKVTAIEPALYIDTLQRISAGEIDLTRL